MADEPVEPVERRKVKDIAKDLNSRKSMPIKFGVKTVGEIKRLSEIPNPETRSYDEVAEEAVENVPVENEATVKTMEDKSDVDDVKKKTDASKDVQGLKKIKCRLRVKDVDCDWSGDRSEFREHCKTEHVYAYSFADNTSIKWINKKVLENTVSVRFVHDEIFWIYHQVVEKNGKFRLLYAIMTEGDRNDYFYQIYFNLRGNDVKRVILEECCLNVEEDVKRLIKCRRCVILNLSILASYFSINDDLIDQIQSTAIIKKRSTMELHQ